MHETPRTGFYPTSCVLELRSWRFAQAVQKAPQVVATPVRRRCRIRHRLCQETEEPEEPEEPGVPDVPDVPK
jgi:hypothetical protein